MPKERICSFCDFRADYDDFPDGSIVYLGICACKTCLEKEVTGDFREIVKTNEWQLKQQTTEKAESITLR